MIDLRALAGSIISDDPSRTAELLDVLNAGLEGVDPEKLVAKAIAGESLSEGTTIVIAAGKAAPAMARGAWSVLRPHLGRGLVISDHAESTPAPFELMISSHPAPDSRSEAAGGKALDLAAGARRDDVVLFLISGGASSLLEVPALGVELSDIRDLIRHLSNQGAPIGDLNTVRTHLSSVKGGRLAAAAAPARVLTLALSDVIDNHAHFVGGGPSVPCPSSPFDALEVLDRYGLLASAPKTVLAALSDATVPRVLDAPFRVIGDGQLAARAAGQHARELGIPVSVSNDDLAGESRVTALSTFEKATSGKLSIWAGETTVTVIGPGQGGRNQEAALAASIELAETSSVFVAFGTDGIDGPTDAAGAIVDGGTAKRGRRRGRDPERDLLANDSNTFLSAVGATIGCGPTGTNVGDLWLVDHR